MEKPFLYSITKIKYETKCLTNLEEISVTNNKLEEAVTNIWVLGENRQLCLSSDLVEDIVLNIVHCLFLLLNIYIYISLTTL